MVLRQRVHGRRIEEKPNEEGVKGKGGGTKTIRFHRVMERKEKRLKPRNRSLPKNGLLPHEKGDKKRTLENKASGRFGDMTAKGSSQLGSWVTSLAPERRGGTPRRFHRVEEEGGGGGFTNGKRRWCKKDVQAKEG